MPNEAPYYPAECHGDSGEIPPLAGKQECIPSRSINLLVVVGLVVFANSLGGTPIYDDLETLAGNPHIRQLWPVWEAVKAPAFSPLAGRPVASLSFAVTYAMGGLNPWIHHVFNITIHILASLVLFGILRRTLQSARLRQQFGSSAVLLSCIIVLLWMVHPLQTESVVYITQRTELLMGLFYLLTLYCSIRSWAEEHTRRWTAAAIAACALGMGSKEVMVSAPLVVLLYDRMFVSGSFLSAVRRHWALYLGLAATWTVLVAILISNPRGTAVGFDLGIRPLDYLRTQATVIVHYLRLSFVPHPLVLSYADWPIAQRFGDAALQIVLMLFLLTATVVGVVRNARSAFLGACFFMVLAPSSSFIPIVTEIAAERRMYLPLAAVIILVVLACYLCYRGAERRMVSPRFLTWSAVSAVALAVLVLSALTIRRNFDYWSPVRIWQENVIHRPNDAFARTELGGALLKQGNVTAATRELMEAVRLNPGSGLARLNLGAALFKNGDFEDALEQFEIALEIKPNEPSVHTNMGITLMRLGRTTEAIRHFREAARLAPDRADVRVNLGRALIDGFQVEEGINELEESLRIRPDAKVHAQLAELLRSRGRGDRAAFHAAEAKRLKP